MYTLYIAPRENFGSAVESTGWCHRVKGPLGTTENKIGLYSHGCSLQYWHSFWSPPINIWSPAFLKWIHCTFITPMGPIFQCITFRGYLATRRIHVRNFVRFLCILRTKESQLFFFRILIWSKNFGRCISFIWGILVF